MSRFKPAESEQIHPEAAGLRVSTREILPGRNPSPAAPLGLSVDAEGRFQLHGRPCRGLGVNYYDAFARTLGPTNVASYEDGFKELAARLRRKDAEAL